MLYFEDCTEGCKKYIPNDSVDLVIADPPYNLKFGGTSMTKNKRPRFGTFANDDLSPAAYRKFCYGWIQQAYRILKPGRHFYVCIDWRTYPDMVRWLRINGFTIKNCIVWDKQHMGMGWQYRFQHEWIIMATKGSSKVRRIRSRSQTDVFNIPKVPGNRMIHPTEKPIDLMKRLIENSSEKGEYVVDLFAGSGVAPAAAEELERKWTAFELNTGFYTCEGGRIDLAGCEHLKTELPKIR